MFRRIRAVTLVLATALGFAAATAGPATTGTWRATTTANTTRTTKPRTTEGQAKHRPTKDRAARILVILGAIYFATLLLLIFHP